jgi:hypothetical protein
MNRERWIYLYTLASSLVLLLRAWIEPSQGLWRIALDVAIPVTLFLASAWLLFGRRR